MRVAAKLLPAEIIVLSGTVFALCISAIFGYSFNVLNFSFGCFWTIVAGDLAAYIKLATISFACLILVRVVRKQASLSAMVKYIIVCGRMMLCFIIAGFLMIIFKWWAFDSGQLWDNELYSSNLSVAWLTGWFVQFARFFHLNQIFYFYVFFFSFIAMYIYCAWLGKMALEKALTLTIAVMVIGGACYMLMPAYGPLVFSHLDPKLPVDYIQLLMIKATDGYRQSHHDINYNADFEMVLGAMPSLHVAHILVFTVYAFRINKALGFIYLPVLVFICIYSSVTKFHYIADIFGGVAVAGLALLVTELLFKPHSRIKEAA